MKSPKEIKLAAINFMRVFKNNEASLQAGTFIPFSTSDYFKQHQIILLGAFSFGLIGVYLAINAFWFDAVYYWHIDLPVIIGTLIIFIYFIIFILLAINYYKFIKVIQVYFEDPQKCPYGVLVTDQYYFENTPDSYHIIARDNIINIDYEEARSDGYYLELLIDDGNNYILQGIHFDPMVFDMKAWVLKDQKVS